MNRNIIGGWKYLNEQTGEFFNDINDIRSSLRKILSNSYKPREWVSANYGSHNSGPRFLEFVEANFGDRVKLPAGTTSLFPAGA